MSTAPIPDLLDSLRAALAGQYEVERQLGAGGMGSVFLARDPTLDRHVAIKVISPELAASRPFRERFLQEARTVARLRHPNIVAVHAAGERDGLLYFVMEYVTGESLRELLDREKHCGGERGTTILRELANALDYAHAHGVVHRDIKPENVLLEQGDGRAMLTDFGVARALSGNDSRMTGTGFVVGSPRYMSPEQAAGERETDGRGDIYSLGLVGYEMFAGEPAFSGPTAASIIVKQMTEPPAPLATRVADAPPRVASAIDRALEKDPGLRWQTAGEMARALETTSPGGLYVSSAERGRRGVTRRRIVVAALALLVAAVPTAWLALRARGGVPAGVDPRRSVLVAPFEIQSGDQSIRWLREGSVNMLALDMAQWKDLQVVSYERSLDLLRDAGLDEKPRIGLDEAREMARKAGVWTVVMGVVSSTPDSLIVRATLYDVASGRGLDEAHRATSLRADPRTLYDQVARDLLDLVGAPALSLDVTKRTTSSLAAYRSYLDGVRLLNGWRLLEADSALKRAIEADSTFALAYYKRTLEIGWRNPLDPEHAQMAQLAVRHADRLAPRERELVGAYSELAQGLSALQRGDTTGYLRLGEAERRYDALVRRDPGDAEAWYGLGDAYFHQAKPGLDPSLNFTRALRAFDRTIALDSTFHLAYSHKVAIYNASGAAQSGLMLIGDSVYVLADSAARRAMGPERIAAAKAQARTLAIHDATRWVELDPDAQQSHVSLADSYVGAGFPDSAALVLERALARPAIHAPELAYRAASLRLAAGTPDAALTALHDALARYPADTLRRWGGYQRFPLVMAASNVAAAAGSLSDLRRVVTTATEGEPLVPNTELRTEPLVRWYEAALQLGMGAPMTPALRRTIDGGIRVVDSLPKLIGTNVQSSSTSVPYVAYLATRDTSYLATVRRWGNKFGMQSVPELDALAALDAGDTTRATALAKEFPVMRPRPDASISFASLRAVTRAEVLIGLGDLRGAIAIYELLEPRQFTVVGLAEPGWPLYVRSYLARGEVYEQLGDRVKAEASYQRFLDLWKDADPSFQGQLQQARDGLRRLRDAPGAAKIGG